MSTPFRRVVMDLVGMAEIAKTIRTSYQYTDRLSGEDLRFLEPEAELKSVEV
jgi:hypothetical protein